MKVSKAVVIASCIGALMLLAMAALHASGYGYISEQIYNSDLSDFLKKILPPLFLYPSALMVILALATVATLRWPRAAPVVDSLVCAIALLNCALGFALGGPIPGTVLLLAASIFGFAAYRQART